MRKPFFLLVFFFVCLPLWGTPATAQDAPPPASLWTVWIYEPSDGQITLVDSLGEVVLSFNLPLSNVRGYNQYPTNPTVSPDGTLIGYILTSEITGMQRLVVADWRAGNLLVERQLPLPPEDGAAFVTLPRVAFHETTESISLGYELYHPEWRFSMGEDETLEIPDRDETVAVSYRRRDGRWAVAVLDPITNSIIHTLRSHSPLTKSAGIREDQTYLPVIQRYHDRQVTFTLVPEGENPQLTYESYTWDLDTRAVYKTAAYLTLPKHADTLEATGEVVMAVRDDRLAYRKDFDEPHRNTLYVYDPLMGMAYPFFHDPEYSLVLPRFIQNDTRIVVGLVDADGELVKWQIVNRDGTVDKKFDRGDSGGVDAIGVPTGYVILGHGEQGEAFLLDVNTLNTGEAELKERVLWFDGEAVSPYLLWAQSGAEPLPDAALPWAQLASPVYDVLPDSD